MEPDLPYFDLILERIAAGDPDFTVALGRHVHWGLWDPPESCTGTAQDYAQAAERLCRRVCSAGKLGDGQAILDVGCGFGGTIDSLNARMHNLNLTGLNIDQRQLERARELCIARKGNTIDFVHGDACALPFAEATFDRVLAVECIFHFPSRESFFKEVARVLRPGGWFALSDFVCPEPTGSALDPGIAKRFAAVNGPSLGVPSVQDYRELAAQSTLRLAAVEDVTAGILPGYEVVARMMERFHPDGGWYARTLAQQQADGLTQYVVLGLQRL